MSYVIASYARGCCQRAMIEGVLSMISSVDGVVLDEMLVSERWCFRHPKLVESVRERVPFWGFLHFQYAHACLSSRSTDKEFSTCSGRQRCDANSAKP